MRQKKNSRRKERENHLGTSCHHPRMSKKVNQLQNMDMASHKRRFLHSFLLLRLQKCLPLGISSPLRPVLRIFRELNVSEQVRSAPYHTYKYYNAISSLFIRALIYTYGFIVQLFLKLSGFQAEVLRLLGGIAAQLQSQAKILRQLEAQRHEPKKPNSIPAVLHLLPLSSHEDVAQLETLLQEDENKEALVC